MVLNYYILGHWLLDNHSQLWEGLHCYPFQVHSLHGIFSFMHMLCEILAAGSSLPWNRLCFPSTVFSSSTPCAAQHCLSTFFWGCLLQEGLILLAFGIGVWSDFQIESEMKNKKCCVLGRGSNGTSWRWGDIRVGDTGMHCPDVSSGKTYSPLGKTKSPEDLLSLLLDDNSLGHFCWGIALVADSLFAWGHGPCWRPTASGWWTRGMKVETSLVPSQVTLERSSYF